MHRGGKARPDLAQVASPPTVPSVAAAPAEKIQKIDFFSDEPLKKKRGGKACPDLAQADGGAREGTGGGGVGGEAVIATTVFSVPVVVPAAESSQGGGGGGGEVKAVTIDFNTPLPRKRGGKARSSSAA